MANTLFKKNQVNAEALFSRIAEKLDWGYAATVDNEVEALRIAYAHRNAKHGVLVEPHHKGGFRVTLYNEVGGKCGLPGAKV